MPRFEWPLALCRCIRQYPCTERGKIMAGNSPPKCQMVRAESKQKLTNLKKNPKPTLGLHGQVLVEKRLQGGSSVRSCQRCPPCPGELIPVGFRTNPKLARAEPITNGDNVLKKENQKSLLGRWNCSQRRTEKM